MSDPPPPPPPSRFPVSAPVCVLSSLRGCYICCCVLFSSLRGCYICCCVLFSSLRGCYICCCVLFSSLRGCYICCCVFLTDADCFYPLNTSKRACTSSLVPRHQARRLVGRRGGVRESNKVELIKSGGGSRRGVAPSRPARGYGGAL